MAGFDRVLYACHSVFPEYSRWRFGVYRRFVWIVRVFSICFTVVREENCSNIVRQIIIKNDERQIGSLDADLAFFFMNQYMLVIGMFS